jgi:surface protein
MSGLILHKNRAIAGASIGYDIIDDAPIEANVYSENWVRPADWISVPDPSVGDEVVYMLYGVDDQHSNYLTIRAAGTFSVDWGDGTSEIVSSGGYSRKEYSFSSISPSAQTSEGFRAVLITVTPVNPNTFTSFSLQEYHSYWTRRDRINILEMKVSAPYMSSFNVGNSGNDNGIQQTDRMRSFKFIGTHKITNASYLFNGAIGLRYMEMDLTGVTDARYMLGSCVSLSEANVSNCGSIANMEGMFQYCYNLRSLPSITATSSTTMKYMFRNCHALESSPTILGSSKVLDTSYMFYECRNLVILNTFDTSKVTNMEYMFWGCRILATVNLFDTSKVTNAQYMFYECNSLMKLPFFDLGSLINATYMFYNCYSVVNDRRTLGLPLFDLKNVTNASYMFASCWKLKIVPNFNLAKVTNMSYMFSWSWQIESFPQFNTPLVTNISYAFQGCRMIFDFPLINTSNVTNMEGMFQNCYSLREVPLFNTSNVTNMRRMFYCTETTDAMGGSLYTLPAFDTSKVTDMNRFLSGQIKLKYFPVIDTSKVTDVGYMMNSCVSLAEFPTLNYNSVTSAYSMFRYCTDVRKIGAINMPKVGDMRLMFIYCYNLRTIGTITTSSSYLWGLDNCFANCHKLGKVNLFDTASVSDFSSVFTGCYQLSEVPAFNTSNVTNFSNAFNGCRSLIAFPSINTSKATNFTNMFYDCFHLENIRPFSMNKADTLNQMFWRCYNITSITFSNSYTYAQPYNAFRDCYRLKSFSMENGTFSGNAEAAFAGCHMLKNLGTFSVSCWNINSMFQSCHSLKEIKQIRFVGNPSYANSAFSYCYSMVETPFINLSNIVSNDANNQGSIFYGSRNIAIVNATASRLRLVVSESNLDWPNISNLLSSLGPAASTSDSQRYIQLSGNKGTMEMMDMNKRKIVFDKGYTYSSHPSFWQDHGSGYVSYPWDNLAMYMEMGNTFSYSGGTTASDISGYRYPNASTVDGTILGNPIYATYGIYLDGIDDGINIGTSSFTATSIYGYFTVFTVIEPLSLPSGATVSLIGRWGATNSNNYYLDFTDGRLRFGLTTKPNDSQPNSGRTERQRILNRTFNSGERYFIAASWNWGSNGCSVWVNGRKETSFYSDNMPASAGHIISVTSSSAPTTAASNFSIGYNQNSVSMGGPAYNANVKIFAAGFYQRNLDDIKIEELHSYFRRSIP